LFCISVKGGFLPLNTIEEGREAYVVFQKRDLTRKIDAIAVPPAEDLCDF
jgi:hypothetical protein